MSELIQQFEEAVKTSKTLNDKPSNDTLLQLYSFYKQATEGDVHIDPPGAFDFVGKAKYDAWSAQKGMSKEDAMKGYIHLINKLKN